jgi:hypothetical protein
VNRAQATPVKFLRRDFSAASRLKTGLSYRFTWSRFRT